MATGYPILCDVTQGTVERDVLIPKSKGGGYWPLGVDIYYPNVTALSVNVFLHGGGGSKKQFAASLNICRGTWVNWALLTAWKAIAIFPQGSACLGVDPAYGAGNNPYNPNDVDTRSAQNPNGVATWGNRFMYSGRDDLEYLKHISIYAITRWPNRGRSVFGHSNGGMMAARLWREAPTYFGHFGACSGPGAWYYGTNPVVPGTTKPFFQEIGWLDDVLQVNTLKTTGNFFNQQWTQGIDTYSKADVEPFPGHHLGAFYEMNQMLGYAGLTPFTQNEAAITDLSTVWNPQHTKRGSGLLRTWTRSGGTYTLTLVENAAHDVATHDSCQQSHLVSRWFNWVKAT